MTSTATAPAPAGYQHLVEIGHDADTGEPVHYRACTHQRVCNGLITGDPDVDKTTLASHIADALDTSGEWLIRHVHADDRDPGGVLHVLTEAENRAARPGRRREPLHLVIWDGFEYLSRDPALKARDFERRVTELAQHGPEYGVAQLVVATPRLLPGDVGRHGDLHALLADNLIALPCRERTERLLGGFTIAPTRLPRERGHALVLVGEQHTRDLVHVHLDSGPGIPGCDTCWRTVNAQLAAPAQPPALAPADAVFARHPGTGLVARHHGGGVWRFLGVQPGDELLTAAEVAELVDHYPAVTR